MHGDIRYKDQFKQHMMISLEILITDSLSRLQEILNIINLEINVTFENFLNISWKTLPAESLFRKVVSRKAPVTDCFIVRLQDSKSWVDRRCFSF